MCKHILCSSFWLRMDLNSCKKQLSKPTQLLWCGPGQCQNVLILDHTKPWIKNRVCVERSLSCFRHSLTSDERLMSLIFYMENILVLQKNTVTITHPFVIQSKQCLSNVCQITLPVQNSQLLIPVFFHQPQNVYQTLQHLHFSFYICVHFHISPAKQVSPQTSNW